MKMKKDFFIGLVIVCVTAFLSANQVQAITVSVSGTSDIWLAGMPDSSYASSGDTAPDQSPVSGRDGDVLDN